jgi:hypothetical protein
MANLVTTQKLLDTEKKCVFKFTNVSDGSAESNVKKIDVSTLNWAKHTLTLSGAEVEGFKIGECISTAAAHSAVADGSEFFIVTGFTAGASTVEVVGWDFTNKKATAADTSYSNADKIVGSVTGLHTRTAANSGALIELDYNVLVTKIQWVCSGMEVNIEWDGSDTETSIAYLAGNGILNMSAMEWPGISSDAAGDSGNVLGDIQFTTVDHSAGDGYTIIIECKKQAPGYDYPAYEENARLGHRVDYVLGNFT